VLPAAHPVDQFARALFGQLERAGVDVRSVIGGSRRHEMHVDQFKPEAGDPQQEPGEGCLIWQLGAKGRRARANGDLAVVEFCA